MKIYTKGGDQGETSLYGGQRVSKSTDRIHAYGTVDELNSWLGLLRDTLSNSDDQKRIIQIQHILFVMGAQLADGRKSDKKENKSLPEIQEKHIRVLEEEIDTMEKGLPPLRHFILPGGHTHVSYCHIARSVCRRAERWVVQLLQKEDVDSIILQYLNRLSDYLFVLARKESALLGADEIKWEIFS